MPRFQTNGFFSYQGALLNGQPHGSGRLSMADGSYYQGEFESGEITGYGVKRFSDGRVHSGRFLMGEMHGGGVLVGVKGDRYEGSFQLNMRHGDNCVQTFVDGSKYEGSFADNHMQGFGRMKYANGDVYEGEWLKSQCHGRGKLVSRAGFVFDGTFMHGLQNRVKGSYVDAFQGIRFEGSWQGTVAANPTNILRLAEGTQAPLEIKAKTLVSFSLLCTHQKTPEGTVKESGRVACLSAVRQREASGEGQGSEDAEAAEQPMDDPPLFIFTKDGRIVPTLKAVSQDCRVAFDLQVDWPPGAYTLVVEEEKPTHPFNATWDRLEIPVVVTAAEDPAAS